MLTPDGLRVVCAGLDNDPEKIGIHMLEIPRPPQGDGERLEKLRRERISL